MLARNLTMSIVTSSEMGIMFPMRMQYVPSLARTSPGLHRLAAPKVSGGLELLDRSHRDEGRREIDRQEKERHVHRLLVNDLGKGADFDWRAFDVLLDLGLGSSVNDHTDDPVRIPQLASPHHRVYLAKGQRLRGTRPAERRVEYFQIFVRGKRLDRTWRVGSNRRNG